MRGIQEQSQLQKIVQAASHPTGTKKEPEKLTQKRVKELFDYDPETGLLVWKDSLETKGFLNKSGYIVVSIGSKNYLAHRLIWLWCYGYFPEHQVDHINRDKTDNRLCNLREVSASCNIRNRGILRNNKSGVTGVRVGVGEASGKFYAFITNEGKPRHLIVCKDFTEAVAYRLAAEQCLGYSSCDSQSSAFLYMQDYIKEARITRACLLKAEAIL